MCNKFYIGIVSVLENEQLTVYDRAVWTALCTFAEWNDDKTRGQCYPGLQSISLRSGCSKSTTCKSIKKLVVLGLVKRKVRPANGGYKSTEYLLFVNEDGSLDAQSALETVRHTDSAVNVMRLSATRTRTVRHTDKNRIYNKTENRQGGEAPKNAPVAKKVQNAKKEAHTERVNENFAEFWSLYPRHEGKAAALKAFEKLFPYGQAKEAENSALTRLGDRLYTMTQELEDGKKELKYIPYAATWLRREDYYSD